MHNQWLSHKGEAGTPLPVAIYRKCARSAQSPLPLPLLLLISQKQKERKTTLRLSDNSLAPFVS